MERLYAWLILIIAILLLIIIILLQGYTTSGFLITMPETPSISNF